MLKFPNFLKRHLTESVCFYVFRCAGTKLIPLGSGTSYEHWLLSLAACTYA